jgi:hypothetical protein
VNDPAVDFGRPEVRATLSLIDLVNALEATSSRLRWRVDLVTGDLLPWSEERGAAPSGDRVRALPRASEIPETTIRLEFCERLRDSDARASLIAAADADVSRAAFDAAVRRAGVLDEWCAHRRARLVPIALAWAAEQQVACRGDAASPSFAIN